MRGRYRSAQTRERAPSPGLLRNPTSPRTAGRGECRFAQPAAGVACASFSGAPLSLRADSADNA